VPKGAPAGGSGSQGRDLVEEVGYKEAVGSQLPEPSLAHKRQVGSQPLEPTLGPVSHAATEFQALEVALCPKNQELTGSQLLETTSGPKGQEILGLEPMEIDASEPPPSEGSRASSAWCTTSAKSSTMPR
jgi:hypothetical protein